MKVLVVSPVAIKDSRQIGGTRTYTLGLLHALCDFGHEIVLLGIGHQETNKKYSVISVSKSSNCSTFVFVGRLFLSLFRWIWIKPDVVNVQLSLAGLPFFFTTWPLVVTMHGSPRRGVLARRGKIMAWILSTLEWLVLKRAERVIFVDKRARDEYCQRMKWLIGKSGVVPAAVDTELFHPLDNFAKEISRRKYNLPPREPLFVFLGRLSPEKNVQGILQIFSKYISQYKYGYLLIMGTGPEEEILKGEVKRLDIERRVRFLPDLTREEIANNLGSTDLFLLSSLHEGLPIAVLEALSCGVPVISTDVGDLSRIISNRVTGEIVSSIEKFPDAMVGAIGYPGKPGWARNTAQHCRTLSLQFSWKQVADDLCRHFVMAIDIAKKSIRCHE